METTGPTPSSSDSGDAVARGPPQEVVDPAPESPEEEVDPEDVHLYVPDPDEMKRESDKKFEDLLGDRQKSVRRIIEETFEDEMKNIAAGLPAYPPQEPPLIPVRFRAPATPSPTHDVFGDALYAIFQKLMLKGQPADFCHWMAYLIAARIDADRQWQQIRFNAGVYETDETNAKQKTFIDGVWPAVDSILCLNAGRLASLREKWTGIHTAAEQLKGSRHRQEDRFVAYPNGKYMNHGQDPVGLLAVFDGHGGPECSQYAAAHLWEEWVKARQVHDGRLEQSLTSALVSLDERMTVRSEKEMWKGGTTAVACAVNMEDMELAFAWLGDSPGYVMNNMEFRKVTREHSPSDPDEARRVEEAGGQLFVIGGELRVNGVLNLTRALGDIQGRPMISNVPESTRVEIQPNDFLVLLACDGVSDVFTRCDLYNLVEAFVNQNEVEEYNQMAHFICEQAIQAGSSDNVTAVIGYLRPPQDVWNLMQSNSDGEDGSSSDEESDEN